MEWLTIHSDHRDGCTTEVSLSTSVQQRLWMEKLDRREQISSSRLLLLNFERPSFHNNFPVWSFRSSNGSCLSQGPLAAWLSALSTAADGCAAASLTTEIHPIWRDQTSSSLNPQTLPGFHRRPLWPVSAARAPKCLNPDHIQRAAGEDPSSELWGHLQIQEGTVACPSSNLPGYVCRSRWTRSLSHGRSHRPMAHSPWS